MKLVGLKWSEYLLICYHSVDSVAVVVPAARTGLWGSVRYWTLVVRLPRPAGGLTSPVRDQPAATTSNHS